jgi:hypothetical protein
MLAQQATHISVQCTAILREEQSGGIPVQASHGHIRLLPRVNTGEHTDAGAVEQKSDLVSVTAIRFQTHSGSRSGHEPRRPGYRD